MSRTLKLVLAVGVATLLMYLAIKPDRVSPEVRQIREINREYPISKREIESAKDLDLLGAEEFETGFMEGCLNVSIDNLEYCKCTFNYMSATFTNQDVIQFIEYMQAEDPRGLEMLNPAVDACIHLL